MDELAPHVPSSASCKDHSLTVRSAEALAKRPSSKAARPWTLLPWPSSTYSHSSDATPQTRTVQSSDALASRPQGSAARATTASVCPTSSRLQLPVSASHTRTVLSRDPLATRPPSKLRRTSPSSSCQMRTARSATASRRSQACGVKTAVTSASSANPIPAINSSLASSRCSHTRCTSQSLSSSVRTRFKSNSTDASDETLKVPMRLPATERTRTLISWLAHFEWFGAEAFSGSSMAFRPIKTNLPSSCPTSLSATGRSALARGCTGRHRHEERALDGAESTAGASPPASARRRLCSAARNTRRSTGGIANAGTHAHALPGAIPRPRPRLRGGPLSRSTALGGLRDVQPMRCGACCRWSMTMRTSEGCCIGASLPPSCTASSSVRVWTECARFGSTLGVLRLNRLLPSKRIGSRPTSAGTTFRFPRLAAAKRATSS
mmetsp:Transcript_168002/g.534395  ORF Transcript_168002/g.534395 Transcript_168002/m.534395 type:complete len:436 (+) Transcript_168002:496-1803(+)